VPTNKTWSDFSAASSAFENAVVKAITGAQMSNAERSRIIRQIPRTKDKPMVWMSKATQSSQNLKDLAERAAAVEAKKAKSQPAPAPTAPGNKVGRFEIVGVK
jgi:hypothetical protein